MEGLNIENIMSQEEVDNLFTEDNDEETQDTSPDNEVETSEETEEETNKENKETTEVDTDTLFTDEPESVGSGKEENKEDKEDTNSNEETGTSPKTNFYSSIASALKEEGIFPDLDDETVDSIKKPEDFADAIEKQVQAKFDERQKRIDEALNLGVEPNNIRRYEATLNYLDSIQEDAITDESDKGETLRKNLILQDFINRGYSKERAEREVKKSFDAGSDIEDAKDALVGNKEFFQNEYDSIIKEAKEEEEKEVKKRQEQAEKLKKSILEDSKIFGDITIDKNTRQKVFDNISKPVFKDDEGNLYTAIQKYEMDNKTDFLKNVGLLFTLTDGFKNIDKLVKGKANKVVKSKLRDLEHTLNHTARTSDGNLNFVSGVSDNESYIGKNWKIDV